MTNLNPMKAPERVAILSCALVFLFLFANATRINSVVQQLDQAYFLETIDTTFENGYTTTMLTRSLFHALEHLIPVPAATACEYPLEIDGREYMNVYASGRGHHSWPLLYVLAGLRAFIPVKAVYYLCALFAFPGLLIIVYLRARNLGLPVIVSIVLLLVVALHPLWSYSSFGQFYIDKLFPPLCIIYLFVLHDWMTLDHRRPVVLSVIGILAASTSERSIIMLVAGTLAVCALFGLKRRWTKLDVVPLILAALLFGYVYIYVRFVQHNPDNSSFSSTAPNFFSIIATNGEAARAIYKFLLINVLLLVPFGIFAKRWTFIAFCSMFPNLLGSIAGAEKLGWTTHYHSYYFPFLIVALIVGASSLFKKGSRGLVKLALVLSIGIILFYAFIDPFPPPNLRFSVKQAEESGLIKTVEFAAAIGPAKRVIERAEYLKNVAAFIPPGSEVSTLESYMPALYEHGVRFIHFYPLGLGKSDYLIVPYTQKDNALRWQGFVSYLGPDVAEQVDSCLQNKINEKYVVIKEFPESQVAGTAILQRH